MGEVERITKTVDMSGEQVEIVMTKMMTPCTQEEFEAMSLEEREHAKIQPALNQRTNRATARRKGSSVCRTFR